MEINSVTIGIVVVVLATLPILYIILNSTKTNNSIKKKFTSLCTQNGAQLTNYEVIGSAILGMDSSHKKVMYSSLSDLENRFQIIDLATIKNCQIKTMKSKKQFLELVALKLDGPEFHNDIVVYEEDDDTLMADPNTCLYEVQKWEQLIKQQLN
ncbi:MAG TPA: hypothetical protein EYN07_06875 [Flavobacteriaceae bacterium]|nr:hypothetical protein [Flavobacteriaceae bacterium]HIN98950.1 hypothetical protein [Flavobacteriaceae bacterium]